MGKFCHKVIGPSDNEPQWRLADSSRGVVLHSSGFAAAVKVKEFGTTYRLAGPVRSSLRESENDRRLWDKVREASQDQCVAHLVAASASLGFRVTSQRLSH